MSNDTYQKLCNISELSDRKGKRFIIDETEVALFKVDNEIYALSNICPHQHSALIYDGFIEDDCVVCPAHGWMFELKTGKLKTGKSRLENYPLLIKDDEIYIKIIKKELNW
jgi:NAD(P)H-dependent nitrite reductase small subunit